MVDLLLIRFRRINYSTVNSLCNEFIIQLDYNWRTARANVVLALQIYQKNNNRSSHQSCSINNYVLGKIHRKHLCQSLLCNKVAGLRPATLCKKRLWLRCFPVSFVKFSRIPFVIEHFGGCFCMDQRSMTK